MVIVRTYLTMYAKKNYSQSIIFYPCYTEPATNNYVENQLVFHQSYNIYLSIIIDISDGSEQTDRDRFRLI